jgi:hypothetical protein
VNETRCLQCETVTSREEVFMDLGLEIENNTSLTACLRQFRCTVVRRQGGREVEGAAGLGGGPLGASVRLKEVPGGASLPAGLSLPAPASPPTLPACLLPVCPCHPLLQLYRDAVMRQQVLLRCVRLPAGAGGSLAALGQGLEMHTAGA